jgi:hypothetical protein
MLTRRFAQSLVAISSILAAACVTGCAADAKDDADNANNAATATDRPPQFVLFAFDGSLNLDFWQESRAWAKKDNVKLTYFMSGVYFIPDAQKSIYNAPHGLGQGKSAIGWGGPAANIGPRYAQVQAAMNEGHEMGSHANGHFDGSTWSAADWESEFTQFDKIMFGRSDVPKLTHGGSPFDGTKVIGFRAPQLGISTGLYSTLVNHHYQYDTSKTGPTNYWPQISQGVWNFPLAELRIVGSGKKTLSMDYNFYFADSKGVGNDVANKDLYKKQMLDTYMQYFQGNYFGNRAPVHIGHHFSKWNGGAYWEAMQELASRVCNLPEVKCVTYTDLLNFVTTNKDKLASYQSGSFTKMPRPPEADEPIDVSAPFTDEERQEVMLAHEAHDNEEDGSGDAPTDADTTPEQ